MIEERRNLPTFDNEFAAIPGVLHFERIVEQHDVGACAGADAPAVGLAEHLGRRSRVIAGYLDIRMDRLISIWVIVMPLLTLGAPAADVCP